MSALAEIRGWGRAGVTGWNRFWFTPSDPATLCLIRVLSGLMLLYTHAVWTLDLEAFFGPNAWISRDAAWRFYGGPELTRQGQASFYWSWFFLIESPAVLWAVHVVCLAVIALYAVGLFSRLTGLLSYVIALAYVHRLPGALFGLDQINTMLAMYAWIGPCGACYSLDAWLRARRAGRRLGRPADAALVPPPHPDPSSSATVAIRLIQLHMCVIYMFAGIGKLTGESWWTGYGVWGAIANLEYQSLDVTWLAHWPLLTAFLTHLTVYWEVYYCALVWPKWTRWPVLALAVPLHLGIAVALGMITFGLVMLIGNLSFVPPQAVRGLAERLARRREYPR